MTIQPFYGELYVEDKQLGRKMLYIHVYTDVDEIVQLQLHNAPPPHNHNNWIGSYGSDWLLKKVKWKLAVTEYELTFLNETPNIKARCLTGHKFGKMIEEAISARAIGQ